MLLEVLAQPLAHVLVLRAAQIAAKEGAVQRLWRLYATEDLADGDVVLLRAEQVELRVQRGEHVVLVDRGSRRNV